MAIDATIGNGYDTLFLARQVGPTGHVYGFDVQKDALAATRQRLEDAGAEAPVTLIQAGHEAMTAHVPETSAQQMGAVMFNLGYLPGSDKRCITRPETTLPALDAAVQLVRPGGVITVVLYVGHEGGAREAEAVEAWAKALDQQQYQVLSYRFINQQNDPPRLLAVEKCAPT